MSSECFFKPLSWLCKSNDNKTLLNAGHTRIKKIIECSKIRGDSIHEELENTLKDESYTIKCHKNCVSTYTSKSHLKRHAPESGNQSETEASATVKRSCRSAVNPFDFTTHCLFCGDPCDSKPDSRHPERSRRVVKCRTAEPGEKSFKSCVLDACDQRRDVQSEEVRLHVQGAVSDLHATDAMYHKICHTRFMAPKSIANASRKSSEQPLYVDDAFIEVVTEMQSDQSRMWNTIDIHKLYLSYGGQSLHRRKLISKLSEHFGNDLLVLSGKGISSLLIFRSKTGSALRLIDDDEDDIQAAVETVARQVRQECQQIKTNKWRYETRTNLQAALADCSDTLLSLLRNISGTLNETMSSALMGNMISSEVNKQTTTLQIALGLLFREKSIIQEMYNFRVCCSYVEICRFKSSAAFAASKHTHLRGMMSSENGLVQAVADNFDASISSANGLKQTHALALLITQVQHGGDTADEPEKIRRLKKEDMHQKLEESAIPQLYCGPKKPNMPESNAERTVLPLSILARLQLGIKHALAQDFIFFKSMSESSGTPEYGGFNTKLAREQGHTVRPATKAVYTPLIDMPPADPNTMLTAMVEAQRLTNETGQSYTIFTADQQLYKVVVDITWVYPDAFSKFIPRLGGMHLLMSFVGCIGTFMSNSGLEDLLCAAFGGVSKMLAGEKFPQNCRALRLLTEELLRGLLPGIDSFGELLQLLDIMASKSMTTKLWLENLIKPTFFIILYVRAECEADWPLHLWCVKEMLPYFFAAGHTNYARYVYINKVLTSAYKVLKST